MISRSLADNIPVQLLYVLESKGSSPGRQGFFMAVNERGEMEGSIGGGIMEHKFVELAKQSASFGQPAVRTQKHDKVSVSDQSGMICSGEQTIWIYPVKKDDQKNIDRLIESLEKNKNGMLSLSPAGLKFSEERPSTDFQFDLKNEKDWSYIEKTGYKNRLFIIGGGHCSLAFSRLMREMDFYITVYDERKELKTMEENSFAHERIWVDDYSELNKIIPDGNNHYVVIMTFGYRTDDIALRSLFEKNFAYIGVLGSASKMKKLFDDYRKEGIDERLLSAVHTPIGIPIRSQTPEEIAISIAAEIIKEKNRL